MNDDNSMLCMLITTSINAQEAEQQRGEESNVEEVTTAKEAVAEAKRAFRKLV